MQTFSFKNLLSIFRPNTVPQYYFSICCILRDENEYLAEWIDYHLRVGTEHFFIYDNGSKIPVRQTIAELNYESVVTVINIPGATKQISAYRHCLKHFYNRSRWIAFIDMDEFIVPKTHDFDLRKFMKQYEAFGGLGLSWLIFGSGGHIEKPAGRQLENFIMRSEISFPPNNHIKSIIQPQYVRAAHTAHSFKYKKGFYCVNEHFDRVIGPFSKPSIDTVQLNHYYCRSLEEFHQKLSRGRSDTKQERKLAEFHDHDRESNKVVDKTILTVMDKVIQQHA